MVRAEPRGPSAFGHGYRAKKRRSPTSALPAPVGPTPDVDCAVRAMAQSDYGKGSAPARWSRPGQKLLAGILQLYEILASFLSNPMPAAEVAEKFERMAGKRMFKARSAACADWSTPGAAGRRDRPRCRHDLRPVTAAR